MYAIRSYYVPGRIYQYDFETGESKLFWQPAINFHSDDYESKQVFYHSKDGTKIPMIITYKKGLELNGKNPTILYSYNFV